MCNITLPIRYYINGEILEETLGFHRYYSSNLFVLFL